MAAGNQPDARGKASHKDLAHACFCGSNDGLFLAKSLVQTAPDIRDEQDAIHCRHAKERNEADSGGNAGVKPEEIKPENSTAGRKWNAGQCEQAVVMELNKV